MATLTGHRYPLTGLADGSRPDVLQLRQGDASLFIGDAKATETPGNSATLTRLMHYGDCLSGWLSTGNPGVFALAVQDAEASGWMGVLHQITQRSRAVSYAYGRIDRIEIGTAVVWQSFMLAAR